MASVLDVLQQLLCYGNNACIQEFQQYAYKPIEGIFYAVFFPIVFILLFVYIVSGAIGSLRAKGFRILIAVAIFAFIIIQGLYHLFLVLGQLWLYVLIFLGFFWMLIHTFVGRRDDGGGAKGRVAGMAGGSGGDSSVFARAASRVKKDLTGETKTLENEIKMALEEVAIVEKAAKRGDVQAWRLASDLISRLHELRRQYLEILRGPMGFRFGGKFKDVENDMKNAIKKLQNVQGSSKQAA